MSNLTLVTGTSQDTADATAVVTLSPEPAPGTVLRFSLVVQDDLGNSSQPAFVDVTVQALPVAVITTAPTISVNSNITLNGAGSAPSGHIKTYKWELVSETPPLIVTHGN